MKEINELKSKYSLLEDDNKTNKLLMEKLLYREEESVKTEENQDENEENPEENIEKNSPRKKGKDDTKKILLLKNEIKHYDKSIAEIEKMIENKKEEEMTKKYIFLSEQTKSKEIELKD